MRERTVARLRLAHDGEVDAIYRESHALWGSGLGLDDYRALWHDLRSTEWGAAHARFCVWVDRRDEVLSSLKVYRPRIRWRGRTDRATVLGAVFTPAAHRRQGHASAMVRAAVREARDRGDRVALLFSDIGTRFYGALGFQRLPAKEDWGPLPARPAPPAGWTLVPMEDRALGQVHAAHDAYCKTRSLAVIRDAEHWRFLRIRSERFFQRLGDQRLLARRQVALRNGKFTGYLLTIASRGEWNVREVGAVGGDAATMASILRVGAARARDDGLRSFYGWLPPEVRPRLNDWKIRTRRRNKAVPMVQPLDGTTDLSDLERRDAVYLPFQDQF